MIHKGFIAMAQGLANRSTPSFPVYMTDRSHLNLHPRTWMHDFCLGCSRRKAAVANTACHPTTLALPQSKLYTEKNVLMPYMFHTALSSQIAAKQPVFRSSSSRPPAQGADFKLSSSMLTYMPWGNTLHATLTPVKEGNPQRRCRRLWFRICLSQAGYMAHIS